jgi:hypothetical protein
MLQSLKRKAPLGPGSRDGLTSTRSGMTVGEMRESCAGKPHALRGRLCLVFANTSVSAPVRGLAQRLSRCLPCHGGGVMRGPSQDASHPSDREAGLPAHAEAFTRSGNCRERNKRKHGPLNLAPLFYVIGAQSSGPSGGDCTLPRSPGLVSGRTALLGLRFVSLTRAHVPPVRSPLRWGGLTGRRVVTLASPPARKKYSFRTTENAARPQAPGLCSTRPFRAGAVSGAREIRYGALLPHILHETIRPDFEDRNARCLFLRSR